MREEEESPYDEIVAHQERVDAMNGKVPSDIDAYGYLEGVLQRRWRYEPELARCARDLLPYQRPKLSVQVQVNSFAEDLEAAIQRRLARATNGMKVIEAKPIEAKPVEAKPFKRRV
jgi:hypothetical protein